MLGMVETDPYPHIIRDEALPEEERRSLLGAWPGPSKFGPEIPGNTAIWLNTIPPPAEWLPFLRNRVEILTRTVVSDFAPWIVSRLGRDIGPLTVHCCVMQATRDFRGHRIHNHHYHSPNWVATALVHLDDDAGGFEGTVINRLDGDAVEAFIHTALWSERPGFSEHATVEYVPGRMFALADGPTSYHSSKPPLQPTGSRRMLRFHVAAPWRVCEALYDVSEAEYCALHPPHETATDARAIDWARRDIAAMQHPARDIADAAKWADRLDVVVPFAAS